jgi:hypothetical protein
MVLCFSGHAGAHGEGCRWFVMMAFGKQTAHENAEGEATRTPRRRQATNMLWGSANASASANANANAMMHRRGPALCTDQTATRGHSYQTETNTGAATRLVALVAPLLRDGVNKSPQDCPSHPPFRPSPSQSAQKHSSCRVPVSRAAFVSRPALLHCCIAASHLGSLPSLLMHVHGQI